MDPFVHTVLAVGCIATAYYVGRHLHKMSILDSIVSLTLDRLEEDGFIEAKLNPAGVKELITIDEIVKKRLAKS